MTATPGGSSAEPARGGASGDGGRRFGFVQFEFPWDLGPAPGRYLLREPEAGTTGEPAYVVVLSVLGAREARNRAGGERRRRRRRAQRAEPEPEATSVLVTRATVIDTAPLSDGDRADAWLSEARSDADEALQGALGVLNAMIAAQRLAAADPYLREVARAQALVVRVGYGDGEQVSEGRFSEAFEIPPPPRHRQKRTAALRPQERVAALLAGRDRGLVCEELILRARLDLDRDHEREAALQVRVALEAALAEIPDDRRALALAPRLDALRGRREAVGDAANAALTGALAEESRVAVAETLRGLEALLRARTAAGL